MVGFLRVHAEEEVNAYTLSAIELVDSVEIDEMYLPTPLLHRKI